MDPRCCFLAQTERCFGKKPCGSFVLVSRAYLRALSLWLMETFKAKCKALLNSRGCFGCLTKPSLITAADEKIQDFWTSSPFEMEHSPVQSQGSTSSITVPSQPPNSSEFVNHGLPLWNQTRQQWLGNKRSEKQEQPRKPTINWDAIYESLHGNNAPFPHPIPLPEMVDFLVDMWEQEGLYD